MPHVLTVTLPDDCRWAAVLIPMPTAEKPHDGQMQFTICASDVHADEVALVTAGLVPALIRQGHGRFPTEEEQKVARARQAILEQHPATRILGRDGDQLWIGDAAVEAGILTRLAAIGWTDCGKIDVKGRACDHAIDPGSFEEKYLAAPVENGAAGTPEA